LPCDTKGGRVPTAPKRSADLARHPDLESGTFYGIVKPDELVKVTLRRIARLLVVFLSISQRSAARHCYNENPYK
jgi:hypothetical protein